MDYGKHLEPPSGGSLRVKISIFSYKTSEAKRQPASRQGEKKGKNENTKKD